MDEQLERDLLITCRTLRGLMGPLMGLTDEETTALDIVEGLITRVFEFDFALESPLAEESSEVQLWLAECSAIIQSSPEEMGYCKDSEERAAKENSGDYHSHEVATNNKE